MTYLDRYNNIEYAAWHVAYMPEMSLNCPEHQKFKKYIENDTPRVVLDMRSVDFNTIRHMLDKSARQPNMIVCAS